MSTTIRSTALDFNNIKNNLKTYLQSKEEFADYNFEASALSNILDVLAHNTHMNGLIANFALNESYLPTAQLRSSMVSLAEGIGYIPDTDTASRANLRLSITVPSSQQPRQATIQLPPYTGFNTTVDDLSFTFRTIEPYYATDNGQGFYEFKTSSGSTSIPVYEGTLKRKTFVVGQYIDNPVYIIPDTTLDADTVSVRVYDAASATEFVDYQNILNVSSISSSSTVYILKEAPNGDFELSFGDGSTFGIAPAAGSRIEVEYLSTKGAAANGASSFNNVQVNINTNDNPVTETLRPIVLQNSAGGQVKETVESIRKNAPFQYASQNRMVTAEDYTSLILRNYSTLIEDIVSWGGEEALKPEFGAVYTSIKFEDDVSEETITDTKLAIQDLANQLSIVSFNLRFVDPVTTYIETDVSFQFNRNLTDLTPSAIQTSVRNTVQNYFNLNTGKFKQAFRRSPMLTLVDDISPAILSSRADVRMQQRFTPSAPTILTVVRSLLSNPLSVANETLSFIVDLVVANRINDAVNYLSVNNLTSNTTTYNTDKLKAVSSNISQQLLFPIAIAPPDDDEYIITSNPFVYNGVNCKIRNQLSSNNLQVVSTDGTTIVNSSIGSFNAAAGSVTINYFNPSTIIGGLTYIKLSAVPSNQSAIAPGRNEALEFDLSQSRFNIVYTDALN